MLPHHHNENAVSAIDPEEVTKVCLRLRHLIQECVPCEMEESKVTRPHSRIITKKVIQAAKAAGGDDNKACVVCVMLDMDYDLALSLLTRIGLLPARQQTLVQARGRHGAVGRRSPPLESYRMQCHCKDDVSQPRHALYRRKLMLWV